MSWSLVPLVELPLFEIVPYPDDWDDPSQRDRWERGRAQALAIPFDELVAPGFARASGLTAEAWRRVVDAGPGGEERGDFRIDGGLGLFADAMPLLLPGCCSCIDEAVEAWSGALEPTEAEWSMLWIGHPWVMGRRAGDALMISKPTESTDPVSLEPLVELPLAQLRQGFAVARVELQRTVPHLTDALSSPINARAATATQALGLGT